MIDYAKYLKDVIDDKFSIIKNKKIVDVYLSDSKELLAFKYDLYPYFTIYKTEGYRCNEVVINHINGIKNIRGNKIIEVNENDFCYNEEIIYTFKTKKGHFDVELKNNNGLDSGNINLHVDYTSKIPLIPDLEIKWNKILEDF